MRAIRSFLLYVLLVTAVLASSGAVALLYVLLVDNGAFQDDRYTPGLAMAMALLMVSLYVVSIIVVIKIVISFFGIFLRITRRFIGETPAMDWATLVSLGICIVLFPSIFKEIYATGVRFISALFTEVPSAAARIANASLICQYNLVACAPQQLNLTAAELSRLPSNLINNTGISSVDIVRLCLVTISFVIVLTLLRRVPKGLDRKGAFWVAYGCLTGFSVYLALSAMLAVPLIADDEVSAQPDTAISVETLTARLNLIYPPEQVDPDWAHTPPELQAELDDREDPLRILRTANDSFNYILNLYSDRANQRLNEYAGDRSGLIQSATTLYETESFVRLGKRERAQHFQDIVTWFTYTTGSMKGAIDSCKSAFFAGLEGYSNFSNAHKRLLTEIDLADIDARSISTASLADGLSDSMRDITLAGSSCVRYNDASAVVPARRDYGSSLGVLGTAASWILSAESIEVVLITGLVGFGLLGALISRFVRSDPADFNVESILEFSLIVLTGFVAALIVYVASFAGIVLLAEGAGRPNPYAVFAACLVGAVFSSGVWDEARKRLSSLMSANEE